MNAPWVAVAIGAASLSLGLLVHVVSLSFRMGEVVRDQDAMKRMLGLSNGTEAVFPRAENVELKFAEIGRKLDSLIAGLASAAIDRETFRDQLTEIKIMLAKSQGG